MDQPKIFPDAISTLFKKLDVPEMLRMRSTSQEYNEMISENQHFINWYNLDRHCPWLFSYSIVTDEDQKRVGYIYGVRTSDEEKIRLGPFRVFDADCWQLVDISENYLLFYVPAEPFSLVVVNVVTNKVESFGVPAEFSLDSGEYVIKIIAEADGYRVVYAQIRGDNTVWYGICRSTDEGRWSRGVLERVDDTPQEVDDGRNNMMLYDGDEDQLYTIFYRDGIPVYKMRKFNEMQITHEPHLVQEEAEIVPTWYFYGSYAVAVKVFESEIDEEEAFVSVKKMAIFERKKNGTGYKWLADSSSQDLPELVDNVDVTLKVLGGVLHIAFRITSGKYLTKIATKIYRFHVGNRTWLGKIEVGHDDGFLHSNTVVASRLTLPLPSP